MQAVVESRTRSDPEANITESTAYSRSGQDVPSWRTGTSLDGGLCGTVVPFRDPSLYPKSRTIVFQSSHGRSDTTARWAQAVGCDCRPSDLRQRQLHLLNRRSGCWPILSSHEAEMMNYRLGASFVKGPAVGRVQARTSLVESSFRQFR